MDEILFGYIKEIIIETITGFEGSIYTKISDKSATDTLYLESNNQYFVEIFADLYKEYYNRIYNHILNKSDDKVVKQFDTLQELSEGFSKKYILILIANITISIHFNIDRKNLNCNTSITYVESVENEIKLSFCNINFKTLFNKSNKVINPKNDNLEPLKQNEYIIDIKIKRDLSSD
jgi:hypothetical protein